MTWDGFGRQQRWIFPSKSTSGVADQGDFEQYGHDPNGNRTSLRKRDGSVLTFHYDALNRVTAKLVPGGGGNVAYAYDLRGLQTSANFSAIGGGVTNAYDGFGRMTSTITHIGGSVRTVSHRYDRDGAEVETTYPDGRKFWTARDGLGRMKGGYSGALGDASVKMTVFYFNPASQLYYFGRRWGTSTYTDFDNVGRPWKLYQQMGTSVSDTASTFAYNPASQLISETRTNDAYAWTGSAAVSRDYGVNGQNQYVSVGSAGFEYDSNGNLTCDGTTRFLYDFENRLISASGTSPIKNATLTYDPLGRLFQVRARQRASPSSSTTATSWSRNIAGQALSSAATSMATAPMTRFTGSKAPGSISPGSPTSIARARSSPRRAPERRARHQHLRRIRLPRPRPARRDRAWDPRPVPIYRPGVAARARHVLLQGPLLLADAGAVPAGRSDRV